LDGLKDFRHPHIVPSIAAIRRGEAHYLMFPWADGGSLQDLWESNPHPPFEAKFVKDIIYQMRGLAGAVATLHNYNAFTYLHGYLKPENVLRFLDNGKVGILKIADMALVKPHVATSWPQQSTGTAYNPQRYEPPEIITHEPHASGRSHLYDMWSMGCITLEVMVWLLYGFEDLRRFADGMRDASGQATGFYKITREHDTNVASVHPAAEAMMKHIENDPECGRSTAIRDLLNIVRGGLLVVTIPPLTQSLLPPGPSEMSPDILIGTSRDAAELPRGKQVRVTANRLINFLEDIMAKGEKDERYWSTGTPREGLTGPRRIQPPVEGLRSPQWAPTKARSPVAVRGAGESLGLVPSEERNVSSTPLQILSKSPWLIIFQL
jgi:serine/threonine protein kinase